MRILVIDVGGTHVKVLATGRKKPVKIRPGPHMTAAKMVAAVCVATVRWKYHAVSIGYPGSVVHGSPLMEPYHLGGDWLGFDFTKVFANSRICLIRRVGAMNELIGNHCVLSLDENIMHGFEKCRTTRTDVIPVSGILFR